jgi:hypothetical protein
MRAFKLTQISDYLDYKDGEPKLFYRATWTVRSGDRGLQKQRQKPPVLSVQTPKGIFYMKIEVGNLLIYNRV